MQRNRVTAVGVIVSIALSAVSLALQIRKEPFPFDRYRQSSASELALRKAMFNIAAVRLRVPDENGIAVPFIEGDTPDGKILIHVDVRSSQLPTSADQRKDALLEVVGQARAAFSWGFNTPESITGFDKWARIQFFDVDILLKSTAKKPLDPTIAIYDNGQLVQF
jgi:hypothetical protein